MYRQPNGWFLRRRPFDPVSFVRRDVHVITRSHLHELVIVVELESCCALQDDHPFMLFLIVPEPVRRCVAVGDDPLDPNRFDIE